MQPIELLVFRGPLGVVEAAALWLAVVLVIAGLVAVAVLMVRRWRQRRPGPPDDWREDRPR